MNARDLKAITEQAKMSRVVNTIHEAAKKGLSCVNIELTYEDTEELRRSGFNVTMIHATNTDNYMYNVSWE